MPVARPFDPSRRLAIVGVLAGAGGLAPRPARSGATDAVTLPEPTRDGGLSLVQALARRRSVRHFSAAPLSMPQLSQLLWATQGITAPGRRTAPSAGALYPLEVLLVALRVEGLAAGAYRFRPQGHVLQPAAAPVGAPALQRAALGQQAVGTAAAVVALTAVASRSAGKYGARAARYAAFEAGAAAQNLALQAVALALGSVVVGGFDDAAITELLQLPVDEQPLALLAIGALP